MTSEMSRRRFIVAAGVATAGLLLPESEGLDRVGNRNELRQFLDTPIEYTEALRPAMANFLSHLELGQTSEVGFAHNANSRKKIDAFILDQRHHVAELDCRFRIDVGPYVSHNRGGKSDIDPIKAYDMVASSPRPKALKYDFKEPEAVTGIIDSFDDSERRCILNADLFHNAGFDMTPEEFVERSVGLTNALLSIGRKGDFGDIEDFVWQFTKLATDNPDRDFILPASIIDFMSSFDEFKSVLEAPNAQLMVYRTGDITLTQRHVNWVKDNFPDDIRSRTFFDL